MGYIDTGRIQAYGARMTAKDYIHMALLGAAERGPLATDDAPGMVQALAGRNWVPSLQMILDGIDDLVADGLLNTVNRAEVLALTAEGRQKLRRLLAQPLPAPVSAFGRVGLRLKLAFIDLATPEIRRRQLDAALRACECEIASRATRCPAWDLNGPFGRAWLDHQVDGLEELAGLLRRMARAEEP